MSNIKLHPGQTQIYSDLFVQKSVRYAVAACCRGWGKSVEGCAAACTAIQELLALPEDVPNKNVFIIAPTFSQVTDIYYPVLTNLFKQHQYTVNVPSKQGGVFKYPKGVELRLVSYEAVERLRGEGCYFVVCDEVRDWTTGIGFKEAWEGVIQPCITTRWSRKMSNIYGASSPGRASVS